MPCGEPHQALKEGLDSSLFPEHQTDVPFLRERDDLFLGSVSGQDQVMVACVGTMNNSLAGPGNRRRVEPLDAEI